MKVTRVGLDLAKGLFQVHGVDGQGKTVLRRKLRRSEMTTYFKQLPACLIGMGACAKPLSSKTSRPCTASEQNWCASGRPR